MPFLNTILSAIKGNPRSQRRTAMSDDESAAASEHEVLEVVAPQASTTASTNGGKKDSAKTKRPAAKIIPDAKDEPEEEPEDNGEGEDEDEEDEDGDEVLVSINRLLKFLLTEADTLSRRFLSICLTTKSVNCAAHIYVD